MTSRALVGLERSVTRIGTETDSGVVRTWGQMVPWKEDGIMGKHSVAKVIELVGSSDKGWSEAADTAVKIASNSIKNITGIEVVSMTAQVSDGGIVTYKSTVKVAFGVED